MRDAAIKSIWNFRCETGNEIMVKTKHDLLDHDVVICHIRPRPSVSYRKRRFIKISWSWVNPWILPKNGQINSFLLLCDVFLIIFWKKLKTPKKPSKLSDLLAIYLTLNRTIWKKLLCQLDNFNDCPKNWKPRRWPYKDLLNSMYTVGIISLHQACFTT